MSEFVDGAVVFFVWWSVWSLLDVYTLRYTPYSELVVLACCALVRLAPVVHRWARARWERGGEAVKQMLDAV